MQAHPSPSCSCSTLGMKQKEEMKETKTDTHRHPWLSPGQPCLLLPGVVPFHQGLQTCHLCPGSSCWERAPILLLGHHHL